MPIAALQPLFARVVLLVQNASTLRSAVTTRSAGTAGIKVVGVAKDQSIVNVIFGLTVVVMESILEGLAVVADLGSRRTTGELGLVARSVFILSILANVIGEFTIHSLQSPMLLLLLKSFFFFRG